jgi:hypothetical protein
LSLFSKWHSEQFCGFLLGHFTSPIISSGRYDIGGVGHFLNRINGGELTGL